VSRFLRAPIAPRQFVEWKPIVFGGGGFVTQLDIHSDGTTVCSTDVAGGYLWNEADGVWEQLQTNEKIKFALERGYRSREGMTAIVIAPSDSNRFYCFPSQGGSSSIRLWRSDNKGASFFPTDYPENSYRDPSAWATSTAYTVGTRVLNGTTEYLCATAHTSGTFATDLAASRWTADRVNVTAEAAGTTSVLDSNGGGYRLMAGKIAVDPVDEDIVYACNPNGYMLRTFNGGRTWEQVTGVPIGYGVGVANIVFDPSSGTTGGRTNVIYCVSLGNGVYRTADAGASWTQISSAYVRPTRSSCVGLDGKFFFAHQDVGATNNRYIDRYTHGVGWTRVRSNTTGSSYAVTAHPATTGKIVAVVQGPSLSVSTNNGDSWTAYNDGVFGTQTFDGDADGPWQVARLEAGLNASIGDLRFDPTTADDMLMLMGQGIWRGTVAGSAPAWTLQVRGIEELIVVDIRHDAGMSNIIMTGWDEGHWVRAKASLDTPPASPLILSAGLLPGASISIDPQNTDLIVFSGLQSSICGYSDDGGATFNAFAATPATGFPSQFATICVNNGIILWVALSSVTAEPKVHRSDDLGASWDVISITPAAPSGTTGFGPLLFGTPGKHIVADYVDPDTFYMSNSRNGLDPRIKGVFKSTDAGLTWSQGTDPYGNGATNAIKDMKAVPGHEGHLFATAGHNTSTSYPSNTIFGFSDDGGATWSDVNSNVRQVNWFGVGKARTVGGYPTVIYEGFYKGCEGMYMICDGDFTEVIQLNSLDGNRLPLGISGAGTAVEADKDIFGRCYVALGGYGAAYCDLI
jgi:hypothetical protein